VYLLLLAVAAFGLAAYFVLDALTVKQKQTAISLNRARTYGGVSGLRDRELARNVSRRLIAPSIERLTRIGTRLPGAASPEVLRKRIQAAGLEAKITPQTFLALKSGLTGGTFLLGLILAGLGIVPAVAGFGVGFAGGAICFIAPDYYLGLKTRRRREEINITLPDILDLLTVSVEAGLGFDGALARITDRSKGPLLEELSIVLHEMRIGESRIQALKNFSERLDMQETTSFARSIIQAEQLGMALGRILRVQASDARQKRQMWAEEKAMKAPIKMLFPTVIFIFPAMFIVILGPAMLQLLKLFKGI
jgi:tight adherence protein C